MAMRAVRRPRRLPPRRTRERAASPASDGSPWPGRRRQRGRRRCDPDGRHPSRPRRTRGALPSGAQAGILRAPWTRATRVAVHAIARLRAQIGDPQVDVAVLALAIGDVRDALAVGRDARPLRSSSPRCRRTAASTAPPVGAHRRQAAIVHAGAARRRGGRRASTTASARRRDGRQAPRLAAFDRDHVDVEPWPASAANASDGRRATRPDRARSRCGRCRASRASRPSGASSRSRSRRRMRGAAVGRPRGIAAPPPVVRASDARGAGAGVCAESARADQRGASRRTRAATHGAAASHVRQRCA